MKKVSIIFFMIISLLLFSNVNALEIGYCFDSSYEGGMMTDNNEKLGITSGRTVLFGVSPDDTKVVSKVDVTISTSPNVPITPDGSDLNSGDKIIGSGGNYTIQINSNENYSGVAIFKLKFPTVSSITNYTVTITAKEYDKSNNLKNTKTYNYTMYVFPKKSNCTENVNINIKSNDGSVKKKSKFVYETSTKKSSIEFTLKPEDSKTIITYLGYASKNNESSFKPKTLSNGKTGTVPLDIGNNQVYFKLETECTRMSDEQQKYVEKCDNVLDEELRETFGGGSVIISVKRIDTRSKVNTLSSLTISDATIDFKPELKNYIVTVPFSAKKVTITSTLTDPKSSYVKGYGNRTVDLKVGSNTVEIKTKAENGSKTTYTLKITRSKNNDSSLKTLKVNEEEILLTSGELVYSTSVPNEITKPTITAIANDSKAKVEIDKIEELLEGMNIINITVTAQNGSKSVYELTINREKIISDNSKLKSIQINNYSINFSPETLDYSLKLEKDVDKLDINVITDSEKANYKVIGNKDLKNESVIKIKVVAEDGVSTTTYSIKIEKEEMKLNILYIIIPSVLIVVILIVVFVLKSKKKGPKMNTLPNSQPNPNMNNQIDQNMNSQANPIMDNQTGPTINNQIDSNVNVQTDPIVNSQTNASAFDQVDPSMNTQMNQNVNVQPEPIVNNQGVVSQATPTMNDQTNQNMNNGGGIYGN